MTDSVHMTRYVRPRMRCPKDEKELQRFQAAISNIGLNIFVWSNKNRTKRTVPLSKKGAEQVALELLAAVNRAIKSGPVANKVWATYVDLYDAMTRFKAAAGHVAALSPEHQFLRDDLTSLHQAVDAIMRPVDIDGNEKARFVGSNREYAFDGLRRGRPIGIQGEIVRAAALVWQANFKRTPPARKGSGFDEALEQACEYFRVEIPGRIILKKIIKEFKQELYASGSVITVRFNRNN